MAEICFKRTEKHYMLYAMEKELLLKECAPYLEDDVHAYYTLCNLYFDTDSDEMIQRSLAKPVYKEKVRLRSYGVPESEDTVFLEIKKKYKGVVYKRRVILTLKEAMDYIQEGIYHQCPNLKIMKEIDYCV